MAKGVAGLAQSALIGDSVVSLVLSQAFPQLEEPAIPDIIDRAVRGYGFGAVELAPVVDSHVRDEVTRVAQDSGARLLCLGGRRLLDAGVTLSGDGPLLRQAVEYACRLVDSAVEHRAAALLVTSGPDVHVRERADARTRLAQALIEVCRYAGQADRNLVVRLEPTDRDIRHRQLIGPTSEALEVANRVLGEVNNFDLNLDLSHLLQLGENPAYELTRSSGFCRHVHLSNCLLSDEESPFYGEKHPPFGLAGSEVGVAELADTLRILSEAGYFKGAAPTVLGLEVVPPVGSAPWSVLEQACDDLVAAEERVARPLHGVDIIGA